MNRSWILAAVTGCVVSLAACTNDRSSSYSSTQNPNARESDNNPNVTLTGCLVQGSGTDAYLLQNVRGNKDKDAKDMQQATGTNPTTFAIVAASDKVDLAKQLNHQVEIKGKPETSAVTPPAGATTTTMPETPRFLASSIKSVADRCTAPNHP
jgi:hypothetical protein